MRISREDTSDERAGQSLEQPSDNDNHRRRERDAYSDFW